MPFLRQSIARMNHQQMRRRKILKMEITRLGLKCTTAMTQVGVTSFIIINGGGKSISICLDTPHHTTPPFIIM